MSVFDDMMKRVSGAPDDIANLAEKIGLKPDQTEKAVAALSKAHQMDGDTIELAAAKTGIDSGTISTIVEQIGGEGSLTEFAREIADSPSGFSRIFESLDADGDGNPWNDLGDKAKDFASRAKDALSGN